jgi:hypothetical protein
MCTWTPCICETCVFHTLAEWWLHRWLNTCNFKGAELCSSFFVTLLIVLWWTLLLSLRSFFTFYHSLTQNEHTDVQLTKPCTATKSTTLCMTHIKHYLVKSTLMMTPEYTPKHIFRGNICGTNYDKGRWYLIILEIIKLFLTN